MSVASICRTWGKKTPYLQLWLPVMLYLQPSMKSWTCLPTTVSFEYRVSRLSLAFSNLAFADRTIVSALSIASWARMFLLKERRDTRLSIWPFACYHLVNRSNSKIPFSLAGYAYKLLLDRKHIIWPGKHISIRPKGYLRQTDPLTQIWWRWSLSICS